MVDLYYKFGSNETINLRFVKKGEKKVLYFHSYSFSFGLDKSFFKRIKFRKLKLKAKITSIDEIRSSEPDDTEVPDVFCVLINNGDILIKIKWDFVDNERVQDLFVYYKDDDGYSEAKEEFLECYIYNGVKLPW